MDLPALSARSRPRAALPPAAADDAHMLGERDFSLVVRLIADYAGIKLGPHKRYMAHNRLSRRLRATGIDTFDAYLDRVQHDAAEREAFVNALTTNLTAFFREPHHFELLRERARAHRERERRALRVWSSACSTGEEPWSIAMTLREAGCDAELLASDIDTHALQAAEAGVYPMDRAAMMGAERLRAHWLRGKGGNEGFVGVRPELRAAMAFRQINLLAADWPKLEPFDVIFCRNVVIYFDREAQRRLLDRFAALLRPGGLLLVGHAESFPAGRRDFHPCGRTAYEYAPA